MGKTLDSLRARARGLKAETFALYLASRDPRTPWYAKAVAALVLGYAFSPIDLIPDFIPVLGILDDVILVPLGIALVIRMIPHAVFDEHRARAQTMLKERRTNWIAGAIIIAIWLAAIAGAALFIWGLFL